MSEERWWVLEDWEPAVGAHRVEALDAFWAPVACPSHSVRVELAGSEQELQGDGYQPDCPGCRSVAVTVRDHVAQVERNRL